MVSQPAELPLPPSSPPASSGDDGGQHTQSKRKPRRDKGQIRFNPRDLDVLQWIGEQYAVRLDSLQRLLGRQAQQTTHAQNLITESSARRVLDRWKQEKLVVGRKILAKEPEWVWLTPQGLRHMDLPFKPKEPSVSQLLHLHLVNQIRLKAEINYAELDYWRGERHLRHEHAQNPKFHVPDGEVVRKDAQVIGIEIERTLKTRSRIAEIVEKLDSQYGVVWYFVTPETRAAVQAATAHNPHKFRLYDLEDFVK